MKKLLCIMVTAISLLSITSCGSRQAMQANNEAANGWPQSQIEASSNLIPQEGNLLESAPRGSSAFQGTGENYSQVSPADSQEPQDSGSTPAEASSSATPLTLTITIPEGYTLARIGMLLEERGVCTAQAWIAAAQNGDFSDFPLVAAQAPNPDRCFPLEGYLFPDTYEIYINESPESIIRRMLARAEQKIDTALREQIAASGYTVDEIITLASVVEKEAFGHEQMPTISSVLHNRLGIGMRLECDVTITYVEGAIKPFITGDKDRYNSAYNTYKCDALPAGAVCNPGLDAIKAAVTPADTDYLFFVTDADKNYYYAATWEEHQKNVQEAAA